MLIFCSSCVCKLIECGCVEPVMTEEQMEAALIEPMWRDYCAHHLVDFYRCRREHFPWVIACKPELHVWQQCEADEYVIHICLSLCLSDCLPCTSLSLVTVTASVCILLFLHFSHYHVTHYTPSVCLSGCV